MSENFCFTTLLFLLLHHPATPKCKDGYFACRTHDGRYYSSECLSMEKLCDATKDCVNGEDEDRCKIVPRTLASGSISDFASDYQFLLKLDGKCEKSRKSGRSVCHPQISDLDISCLALDNMDPVNVNVTNGYLLSSIVFPPRVLARVLMREFRKERTHRRKFPDYSNFQRMAVLKFACDHGFKLLDEVAYAFCSNGTVTGTLPSCVPLDFDYCETLNGGCSHTCENEGSVGGRKCSCPENFFLDADGATCVEIPPANPRSVWFLRRTHGLNFQP